MSVKDIPEWSEHDLAPTANAGGARESLPERLRLIVLSGVDRGRELVLRPGRYTVGKLPRCSLVLRDELVSRRHLEVHVGEREVQVKDLGSRNGSFFQGVRFSSILVEPGAVVRIGETELQLLTDRVPPLLPSTAEAFGRLQGRSLAMRRVFAVLERVAPSDVTVLIEGETGSGKGVCAESIHAGSPRAAQPFVVVDLAAVERGQLEAELFGRGAPGAFERAHGGTLFLDELGELDPALQPRLLRALDRLQVSRLGETELRTVDVRILGATNRDLDEEVKAGRFRGDLLHRLSVVRVKLPPLRERKDDLPLLVEALGHAAQPEALGLLAEHDWRGNVRELANVLAEGAQLAGPGAPLELRHLRPRPAVGGGAIVDFHAAKEEVIAAWEAAFLKQLVETHGHNLSRAARMSGLGRPHLYKLLRKHKLL